MSSRVLLELLCDVYIILIYIIEVLNKVKLLRFEQLHESVR